ncbi:MAG: multidrug ABC transporter ATP-binding protein [Cyclobacteriaceae bacterium]|nr:MAG: multidrug ABC transporter ATP-binding protein [Cyclobacteriaceae bacterium]
MAKREPLAPEDKKALNRTNLQKLLHILRFVWPYRMWFLAGLLALILSSLTLLSFPYFAGQLLDIASGKTVSWFSSINQVALLLISILLVQAIFSFTRVYTFSVTSERSLADLRLAVYRKIIWQPMSFFDSRRVGELISRITADVGTLHDLFTFTLAELLRQTLTLILGTAWIFYLAPSLTAFMLLTFPVLVILALVFGKYIRKLSRQTQDKLAEANVVAEESLQSVQVVKAFTNEWLEAGRYAKALTDTVSTAIRTARYRGLFISFAIFTLFGGIVAVGWFGASLVQRGELSVGMLFSFIIYTSFIGGSIAGLGDIYTQVQRAIGASERLQEILQQQDESNQPQHPEALPRFAGKITFRNVWFEYPARKDVTVLRNLNFTIAAGEKVALVGPSGAGKSTIINLLMRYYPVTRGEILVDDRPVLSVPLSAYRKHIGIVPQEVILFGGTIRENIAYGKPDATDEEIRQAAEQANALEFIMAFPEGFNTRVGERGVKLSGGQRQRIAIARAILKDPAILVLDEATSSLDAHAEVLVQQALEKLMAGRTTIIIAHRLSTVRKADRIFVINRGELAEVGSHAELSTRNNGLYRYLLSLQLQES